MLLSEKAYTNADPTDTSHEFRKFANFYATDFMAELSLLRPGQFNTLLSGYLAYPLSKFPVGAFIFLLKSHHL